MFVGSSLTLDPTCDFANPLYYAEVQKMGGSRLGHLEFRLRG
jgi:hypothetical protein